MSDIKFNNYSLTNDEVEKIIKEFEKDIENNSIFFGKVDEDCEQEIRIQIYKALTKNSKNNF